MFLVVFDNKGRRCVPACLPLLPTWNLPLAEFIPSPPDGPCQSMTTKGFFFFVHSIPLLLIEIGIKLLRSAQEKPQWWVETLAVQLAALR